MEPSKLAEVKRAEIARWDGAARGWNKWFYLFERGSQPLSDRMVELAGLRPGMRVLDVASGLGEPAVSAARRVGSSGRVLATDAAPAMVAHARERVAPLGLPQLTVRQLDAEAPGLPARSFDAVLCRFGLMFLPALDRALVELRALLAPGGRLCAAVWSTPDRVPFLWVAQSTARRVLGLPLAPTSGQSPFDLADPHALAERLRRAGFTGVKHEAVPVVMRFVDPTQFVEFVRDVSTSMATLLADRGPAERGAVWSALADAASAHVRDGEVVFENEAFCVTGEAPG